MTTPRRFASTLFAAALLSSLGAATAASAAIEDPDGDGDLVCPPGATNASYCTEDESGPAMRITPDDVTLTRDGHARMHLLCYAPAGNRCRGMLTLTTRQRVVRGRRVSYRTVVLGDQRFSIRSRRVTNVSVPIDTKGRRLIASAGNRGLRSDASVVARFADNRNRKTSRTIVLRASR
jgi:hypothetical protein